MSRFAILSAAVLVLACLSSCSDEEDRWTPDLTELNQTRVYVSNFSPETINEVYLRSAGSTDWGRNRLTGPIAGGNLYTEIGSVLSGRFDVRMVGEFTTQETLDLNLVGDDIGLSFHAPPAR